MNYRSTFALLMIISLTVPLELLDTIFLILYAIRGVTNSKYFNYINPVTRRLEDRSHFATIIVTWICMAFLGITISISPDGVYLGHFVWAFAFIIQYLAFRLDCFINEITDNVQHIRNRNIASLIAYGY